MLVQRFVKLTLVIFCNYMNKLFSSVGPHAAMNHYSPNSETDRPITMDEIYLVDSGGQYKVKIHWISD